MGYGGYMFGKKEFGFKCETEISDMRFPRDDSLLDVEWMDVFFFFFNETASKYPDTCK